MNRRYCILFIFYFCCCHSVTQELHPEGLISIKKREVVVLQPLGSFPGYFLAGLKNEIEKFYSVTVTINPVKLLPANAYYPQRNRYKADSIIHWLSMSKPDSVRLTAGLTSADIFVKKGVINDYGIMGLGYQPGGACVISTFRLQRDHPSESLLSQRILKTILHEMGHNFGLPHCTDKHCIMADASGKMKQDNEDGFCAACRKKLKDL